MYLLDTNACIRILNNRSPPLVERLQRCDPSEIRLSSVVKAELLYGARRSLRVAENLAVLARFFQPFVTLAFDDVCAEHYGVVRVQLEREGRPIGPNDLMIAATALAHGLVLVTNNTGEFSRVAGLAIEDWQA